MTDQTTAPAAAPQHHAAAHAQPRTDEQHRALATLQALYGETMDDIQSADRQLRRSFALRAHLVARMVAVAGDRNAVAQLLGQTPTFVQNCVMQANGFLSGMAAPQVPEAGNGDG